MKKYKFTVIKEFKKEIERVLELCSIGEKKNKMIFNLSKGFKQRGGIAQALISNPKVLILDEPTTGLDPAQIVQVRQLIKSLGREHTIILSTHILSEIQAICNRIIIINDGKIVANDNEEDLLKSDENVYFLKIFCSSVEKIKEIFREYANSIEIKKLSVISDEIVEIELVVRSILKDKELFISNIFLKNNIPILKFSENRLTLEQLFIQLIEKKIIEKKI